MSHIPANKGMTCVSKQNCLGPTPGNVPHNPASKKDQKKKKGHLFL